MEKGMMTKDWLAAELAKVEKAIQAAEQLRQKALAQKEVYEQQLKEVEEELRRIGVDPSMAKGEILRLEQEIEMLLKEINEMIPYDLLQKYAR
ncbi:hypothetical protein [Geobacillus subterraneus]|uniref:Uncharacterized protein n=1 Tax=Geobacillus subterraneus TaxID=129338 RepID=A0A679FW70_9BACL|nr:hypothetical protein [Geobacillus subterraneus]BBW98945.1 hypothetical protein GsuE55_37780 [Geobacillus subterraneus]